MLKRRLKYYFAVFAIVVTGEVAAQINTSSPYSRFGIGDINSFGVGRNQMMGGLGVSTSNALFINNVNPALAARSNNVIFNIGFTSDSKFLKTSTQSQNSSNVNLSTLNMSFPLSKKWTSGIGLYPYSRVDYDISSTQILNDTTNVNYLYTGTGGLNKFYWTNGFSVSRGIYLGLESSYVFGNIRKESESQLEFNEVLDFTKSVFANQTNFSDFSIKPGFAIRKEIRVSRDTVHGTVRCNNSQYMKFSQRLELCIDTVSNERLNLTEPKPAELSLDTLPLKEQNRIMKEDRKRMIEEREKNRVVKEGHCKAALAELDEKNSKKNSFYVGNKVFVQKDTSYIGNKLFSGKSIKRAAEKAYDGKYIVLIASDDEVSVSGKIKDADEVKRLTTFFSNTKPKGTSVVIKASAQGVEPTKLKEDLDSVVKKLKDKQGADKVSSVHLKNHVKQGSGIFFNFGSTYEFKTDIRASNLQVLERRLTDDQVVSTDTLNLTEMGNGNVVLPSIIKFGIGLERPVPAGKDQCGKIRKSVWAIGLDFSYSNWSQYQSFVATDQLSDSYRIVLGGEIIPNILSRTGSLLPHMIFRGGLHYEKTPYVVNTTNINDFGINFGVSLPLFKTGSAADPRYLDLGFSFGQRGTINNNLIRENYLKATVNYTINSKWFQTYKRGL